MKLSDWLILGALGVGAYFVYKFTSNPIEAAHEYPQVAMTSGVVSAIALVDNVLTEIGAVLKSLPQVPLWDESAPFAGFTGQE